MALSCEQSLRSGGVCVPALEPRGEEEGSQTRCQDFKPDLGNPAVRNYRGGLGKRSHGGIVNPPRYRKGEPGNPLPKANASEFYPNHLSITDKCPRCEANRKKSKLEC